MRSAMCRLVLALGALLPAAALCPAEPSQPTVLGRWLSEGRDGVIEIFSCADGALCGRLAWFKPDPEDTADPPVDRHNPEPALRGRLERRRTESRK